MSENISKTRKAGREILTVSLPISLFDHLQSLCKQNNINRSALVAVAIAEHLQKISPREGAEDGRI